MNQKLLIGGLAVVIVAVIGFGLYDAAQVTEADIEPIKIAVTDSLSPTATSENTVVPVTASAEVEVTAAVAEPQVLAQGTMGDPWQETGTIAALDDLGLTLATAAGEFYVELGPSSYWQAQDVSLAEGDTVSVDGYYNGEQVHARVVTANGAELVIRSESGQPMWSGGADNGNGNGGSNTGQGTNQTQVSPEDWVTLTGTIGSVANGNVTLFMNDGSALNLQMGQPQFWQSQGVTLSAGDPVEVLGFWQGNQFMAGEIRKTETGETIMLRDPNGRQLWAGPGRNGNSGSGGNGNGNGGNGNNGHGNGGNGGNGNNAATSTTTGG